MDVANLSPGKKREVLKLLKMKKLNRARNNHLDFMKYCWTKNPERDPFIIGFHTRKICKRIDQAFEDLRNGKPTHLLIAVHHRSGKSDIVSRYLGAHFLGEFPDQEVMQVTYKADFAISFSAFGRKVMQTDKYKRLYPGVNFSKDTNKKNDWLIADKNGVNTGGRLYASGLHSGLTGNGFTLGILDDYCSGREEAESLTQRNNAWDAFTNDFMTRVAPVGIVIILATQWHYDDINGRIRENMKEDPNFPKFENLSFTARAEDYRGEGKYPGKFLFLERFPERWYLNQYAILGRYSAAALLDCNPQMRTGGQLSIDGIIYHEPFECPEYYRLKWARVWDLAHTEKQRQKDDPDYTAGTLLAFEIRPGDPVRHLWVKDVVRIRKGATKRDKEIKKTIENDGPYIVQAVESSLDSKDAYEYLRDSIKTVAWRKINIKGDKTVRATPLEPIFEAPGHVHVIKGSWNQAWIDEVSRFTGTGDEHDDQVDNMSAGYILLVKRDVNISEETKNELAERFKKR